LENSFRKAYTARTLRSPSGALAERIKTDPIFGNVLYLTNIIALPGALPIKVGDETIARPAFPALQAAKRTRLASRPDSTRWRIS
jgi:hypothetical protein